jgi:alpha-beta hydrolase superfamily lysophospholipase
MDEPEIKYKVSTKRKIMRWATVIVFIYASAGIALYYLQEKFLFHPDPLSKDFEFKFKIPFREVNIPMNARDNVNMIQFYPANTVAKGVVLYFHGNRGNAIRYEKYANNFLKNGYEVWIPDYPGYGKTTGKLSEENMNLQAKEVYNLAHSKFSADRIFVYGKSLGSGVAAYVAAKKKCRMLILETPYFSIPDLFSTYAPIYPTSRMSHFKFPVGEYLKDIKAPVIIFHGTSDETIPYRSSAKLKKFLKPGDEFIIIENAGHNNLNDFPIFQEKIDSVLNLK